MRNPAMRFPLPHALGAFVLVCMTMLLTCAGWSSFLAATQAEEGLNGSAVCAVVANFFGSSLPEAAFELLSARTRGEDGTNLFLSACTFNVLVIWVAVLAAILPPVVIAHSVPVLSFVCMLSRAFFRLLIAFDSVGKHRFHRQCRHRLTSHNERRLLPTGDNNGQATPSVTQLSPLSTKPKRDGAAPHISPCFFVSWVSNCSWYLVLGQVSLRRPSKSQRSSHSIRV